MKISFKSLIFLLTIGFFYSAVAFSLSAESQLAACQTYVRSLGSSYYYCRNDSLINGTMQFCAFNYRQNYINGCFGYTDTNCSPGKHWDNSVPACVSDPDPVCSITQYLDTSTTPHSCQPNKCPVNAPAGSYINQTTGLCESPLPCSSGEYRPTPDSACVARPACPANQQRVTPDADCTPCPSGTAQYWGSKQCVATPAKPPATPPTPPADGVAADGTRTSTTPDGVKVSISPDGTTTTYSSDGKRVDVAYSDGSKVTYVTDPSGLAIVKAVYANGDTVYSSPTTETKFNVVVGADGVPLLTDVAGSRTTTYLPDGTKTVDIIMPDGTRIKEVTTPDGKTTISNVPSSSNSSSSSSSSSSSNPSSSSNSSSNSSSSSSNPSSSSSSSSAPSLVSTRTVINADASTTEISTYSDGSTKSVTSTPSTGSQNSDCSNAGGGCDGSACFLSGSFSSFSCSPKPVITTTTTPPTTNSSSSSSSTPNSTTNNTTNNSTTNNSTTNNTTNNTTTNIVNQAAKIDLSAVEKNTFDTATNTKSVFDLIKDFFTIDSSKTSAGQSAIDSMNNALDANNYSLLSDFNSKLSDSNSALKYTPDGSDVESVKSIVPHTGSCQSVLIPVNSVVLSSVNLSFNLKLDTCLLSTYRDIIEWVIYALTAIYLLNVFFNVSMANKV